jgi:hypothetical protein
MARMRITRRPPPLVFGASNDDGLAAKPAAAPAGGATAASPAREAETRPEAPPTPARAELDAAAPVRQSAAAAAEPSGWLVWLAAFVVAVLWALGPIASRAKTIIAKWSSCSGATLLR